MIFRPFYYFDRGCAAYLFGCGSLGRCAVVDARADDVDTYITFAASKNMRITHVIDTHVHADHRSGGPELAAARSRRRIACTNRRTTTGRSQRFATVKRSSLETRASEVIHTPGHSPESVCLLVTDLRRGTEPWFVLTGDTLFVGAVGRPDLPGRARENAAAALQQHPREAAHTARRSRGVSRPFLGVRVRRRLEREADEHHRLRASMESDALSRQAGVHRRPG